jgi:hypothetical protein
MLYKRVHPDLFTEYPAEKVNLKQNQISPTLTPSSTLPLPPQSF